MKTLSRMVGFLTAGAFTATVWSVLPSQTPSAIAAIPCRSSYSQDFSWRKLNRTGRVLIDNKRSNPVRINLIHSDSASQFANWTIGASNRTFLVYNNQPFYVGDDWGIQIDGGCIFYVGEVGIYNSQVYTVTLSGSNQISVSGLQSPYSPQPQPQPQPGDLLSPETSPQVIGHNFAPMGGGKGIVTATLNRDGLLIIEGAAESNSKNTATRASTFVVAIDRRGRTLFTSNKYDISTACGTWDPTCPSKTRDIFRENVGDVARYVWKLDVYLGQHGETGFDASLRRINENIRVACSSYDDLPVAARAAIAYKTGFAGCNPGQ